MSNLRLFSLAVFAVTLGISGGATSRRVVSLDEIFQTAEQNSATLRASEAAREEARRDISVARSQRLPDINASLGVSYIGDGFTGAVVGATFGPAIVGELLSRLVPKTAHYSAHASPTSSSLPCRANRSVTSCRRQCVRHWRFL